jgi:HPt (histidine-containing phosphotransfer) domain-containing protein
MFADIMNDVGPHISRLTIRGILTRTRMGGHSLRGSGLPADRAANHEISAHPSRFVPSEGKLSMHVERPQSESVLEVESTVARLGGDQKLFVEMIGFFLEDAPRLEAGIHAAVEAKNASTVRLTAHALKGLVAGCGGVRAAQSAQRVEDVAQLGDLRGITPLLDALAEELELLRQAVRAYRP